MARELIDDTAVDLLGYLAMQADGLLAAEEGDPALRVVPDPWLSGG